MMTPADEEVTYIPTVPPVDGPVFEDETKLESESAPIVGEEENDTLNHDSPATPTSPTLQNTYRMPPITKIPIEEQRTEWLAHFLHSPSSFHARATHRSVDDRGLRGSLLRGVYWRLFLGELDRSDMFAWSTGLQEKRAAYEALCQKHKLQLASLSETVPPLPVGYRNRNSSTDPDGGENSSAHDLKSNNPLSQAADNPWTSYFADNELSETIRHDLNRTHADSEFFTSEVVQDIMFNILYIWGKEIGNDKEGRYRQGFNEILAPIVLVCMRESQWLDDWKTPSAASPSSTTSASSPSSPSSSSPSSSSNSSIAPNDTLLAEILDRTKVEHDCYGLFVAIMAQIGQYFIRVDVAPTSKDVLAKKRASIMAGETQPANETSPADQTPIIRKCTYIHHILLSTLDPILYDHLVKMDVQPNIYILRWYRLMLSREFHLEDTLVIWDVIFATMERPGENGSGIVGVAKTPIAKSTGSSSPTVASMPLHSNAFVLTEYVCISMLLYVRTALLHGDNVYCLRRLLRYPPVEDIRVLLARALHFLNSWKMITSDPTLTREVFDPTLVTDAERMNSAFDGPWARMQEGMGPDAPLEDSTSSSSPSAAYASSTSSSVASGVGYTSTAAVAKTLISDGLSTLRSFMKGAVAKVGEVPGASSTIPSAGTVSRAQTTTSHTSGGVTKKHATLPAGGVVHAPNRKLPQASGVSHFLTPASLTSSQKSSISSISSTSPQPSSAHPPGTIPSPPTAKEYDELILLRKQLRTVEVERDAALHQVHALQVRSSHSKQLQRHLGQLVEHVTNQLEREWEATSVEATRQKPKRKESTTDAKEAEYTPVPTETPSDAEATDAANLSSNPPVASSFSSSSTATTPPPAPLRPFSEDVLLTGVAELKHIKDVLVGRLTITDVIQHLEATRDDAASAAAASVSSPKGASPLPSRAAILRELTDLHATTQAALPNDDDQAKSSTAFPYNLPAPLPNGGKKRAPLFEPEVASRDAVRDLFALEESDALPGIYPKIVTPVESAKNKNVTGAVAKSGDALNSSLTDPLLSPTQSTSSATPTTLATGAGTPTASTSTPTVSNTKADVTVSSAKSNDLLTGLLSPSPSDESTPTDSSSHLRASSSSSSLFSNSPPSSPFGPTASQSRMKSTTTFSPAFDLEQDDSSILLPKASAFRDPPRAVPKPTAVPKKSTTTNTTAMTATSKPTAAKSLLDDPLSRASTSTTKSKPFSDPLFGDD